MVDDVKLVTDDVDDPSTRPQAGAIASRFRSRDHHLRQAPPLGRGQFRRSSGRGARLQPGAALASVRALPSADRASIDAKPLRHDMNGDITLKPVDRTEASLLEFSRAPLWAQAAPPTEEHSLLGHYLGSYH